MRWKKKKTQNRLYYSFSAILVFFNCTLVQLLIALINFQCTFLVELLPSVSVCPWGLSHLKLLQIHTSHTNPIQMVSVYQISTSLQRLYAWLKKSSMGKKNFNYKSITEVVTHYLSSKMIAEAYICY